LRSNQNRLGERSEERKTVVKWADAKEYEYVSWQGEVPEITLPSVDVVAVRSQYKILVSAGARKRMNQIHAELLEVAHTYDTEVEVNENCYVPGFHATILLAVDEERVEKIRGCFAGSCGQFMWISFLFIGYQAAFECFCNLGYDVNGVDGPRLDVLCTKQVSDQGTYRARYEQDDFQADAEIRKLFISDITEA
jgi:hypothetical protein